MTLPYLDFDYSEDTEGNGNFDAMASVTNDRQGALYADILEVMHWACSHFGAPDCAIEDGGAWLYDLQAALDDTAPQPLEFDASRGTLQPQPLASTSAPQGHHRLTITFSLSGNATFCEAFRSRFAVD